MAYDIQVGGGSGIQAPSFSHASAVQSRIESQIGRVSSLMASVQGVLAEIAALSPPIQGPSEGRDAFQRRLDAFRRELDALNRKLADVQAKLAQAQAVLQRMQGQELPEAERRDAQEMQRALAQAERALQQALERVRQRFDNDASWRATQVQVLEHPVQIEVNRDGQISEETLTIRALHAQWQGRTYEAHVPAQAGADLEPEAPPAPVLPDVELVQNGDFGSEAWTDIPYSGRGGTIVQQQPEGWTLNFSSPENDDTGMAECRHLFGVYLNENDRHRALGDDAVYRIGAAAPYYVELEQTLEIPPGVEPGSIIEVTFPVLAQMNTTKNTRFDREDRQAAGDCWWHGLHEDGFSELTVSSVNAAGESVVVGSSHADFYAGNNYSAAEDISLEAGVAQAYAGDVPAPPAQLDGHMRHDEYYYHTVRVEYDGGPLTINLHVEATGAEGGAHPTAFWVDGVTARVVAAPAAEQPAPTPAPPTILPPSAFGLPPTFGPEPGALPDYALQSPLLADAPGLAAVLAGQRTLAPMPTCDLGVHAIQQALSQVVGATLAPAEADHGTFGATTEAAVATFQRQVELPVTGRIDAPTLAALDRALAALAAPVPQETPQPTPTTGPGEPGAPTGAAAIYAPYEVTPGVTVSGRLGIHGINDLYYNGVGTPERWRTVLDRAQQMGVGFVTLMVDPGCPQNAQPVIDMMVNEYGMTPVVRIYNGAPPDTWSDADLEAMVDCAARLADMGVDLVQIGNEPNIEGHPQKRGVPWETYLRDSTVRQAELMARIQARVGDAIQIGMPPVAVGCPDKPEWGSYAPETYFNAMLTAIREAELRHGGPIVDWIPTHTYTYPEGHGARELWAWGPQTSEIQERLAEQMLGRPLRALSTEGGVVPDTFRTDPAQTEVGMEEAFAQMAADPSLTNCLWLLYDDEGMRTGDWGSWNKMALIDGEANWGAGLDAYREHYGELPEAP